MPRTPAAHHLAKRRELAKVIAVVIADYGQLAKDGVAGCSLENGEQVNGLVGADPLKGAQIVVELLDRLSKPCFVRHGVFRGPVFDWPARRDVSDRVLAVAEDVPLGDPDVLEDVPRRVVDVWSTLVHCPCWEVGHGIVEAHMSLGSAELTDQHPALGVHFGGRAPLAQTVSRKGSLLRGSPLASLLGHLVACVVARADQRTQFDVLEAERQCLVLHLRELSRVVEALQHQVLLRWAEVLADGEDVAVDRSEVDERLAELLARLTQADHEARLSVDGAVAAGDLASHLLGVRKDFERAVVAGALADRLLEPLNGLQVVVQDVRPGLHDCPQRLVAAIEVRDQDLDAHSRTLASKRADSFGKDVGATVREVVASHARHDHVLEAHLCDRLGDSTWLVLVVPGRPARLDGAEATGPRADVAENHDRGGALLPALPDVGTVGFLAHRVQRQAAQDALQLVVVLTAGESGLDPFGVATQRGRAVSGGFGE